MGDGAGFLPLSSALRSDLRPEFSLGDRIMNCALISLCPDEDSLTTFPVSPSSRPLGWQST